MLRVLHGHREVLQVADRVVTKSQIESESFDKFLGAQNFAGNISNHTLRKGHTLTRYTKKRDNMVKYDSRKTKRKTLCEILNMDKKLVLNDIYKSHKGNVNVLFIAESPPENEKNYFYYLGDNGNNNFIGSLMNPLCIKTSKSSTKKDRIIEFIKRGYWLTDLFYEPITEVNNAKNHFDILKNEIEALEPKKVVMMLPKKSFEINLVNTFFNEKIGLKYEREANFIKKQEMICERLREKCNLKIDYKIAPFPSSNLAADEWKRKSVCSFCCWVLHHEDENGDKIKDWLEINCE